MDWPIALGTIAALFFLITALVIIFLVVRLRRLYRRVGSFDCSLKTEKKPHWRSGVAVFGARYITWYRTVALSRKPEYSWARERLRVLEQRRQDTASGTLIVKFEHNGQHFSLATTDSSFQAVVSWMDAAPPSEEPTSY